jgi:hypothetical protein
VGENEAVLGATRRGVEHPANGESLADRFLERGGCGPGGILCAHCRTRKLASPPVRGATRRTA